jgi:hypothetical protein
MTLRIISLAALLAWPSAFYAQDVTIHVELESKEVRFGQPFQLKLRLLYPENCSIAYLEDPTLWPLQLQFDSKSIDEFQGRVSETQIWQGRAMHLPSITLKPLRVEIVRHQDGAILHAISPEVVLEVTTSLTGHGEELESSNRLPDAASEFSRSLITYQLGISLCLLVALIIFVTRRRPAAPPIEQRSLLDHIQFLKDAHARVEASNEPIPQVLEQEVRQGAYALLHDRFGRAMTFGEAERRLERSGNGSVEQDLLRAALRQLERATWSGSRMDTRAMGEILDALAAFELVTRPVEPAFESPAEATQQ